MWRVGNFYKLDSGLFVRDLDLIFCDSPKGDIMQVQVPLLSAALCSTNREHQ